MEAGETPKLRPTERDPEQKLPFAPVTGDAPNLLRMRLHHAPQPKLLQVRELRRNPRVQSGATYPPAALAE